MAVIVSLCWLIGFSTLERPSEYWHPEDLNYAGCRVGALAGYDSERVARSALPKAKIVGFSEFEDAFVALLAGKIEGFVYNEHVLNTALRTHPDHFRILEEPMAMEPAVVLVSKKSAALLQPLNEFIRTYHKSECYYDMYTRWCQNDEYVPMPEIPVVNDDGAVLRIGTSGTEEPSSFFDADDELTGFDIEFARRFAAYAQRKPQFICCPDDEIIDELREGKLDIVIDDYNANEAPEDVLCSLPYFDSDTKMLVRSGAGGGMDANSFGASGHFIGDPRVRFILLGFVNTLALFVLSTVFGFALARIVRELEKRGSRRILFAIDYTLEALRYIPPPILLLVFFSAVFRGTSAWLAAVLALSIWFAARMETVCAAGVDVWLPIMRLRMPELIAWTSVVGTVGICDLTYAADLICARSLAALGPLVSIAAAYGVINWVTEYIFYRAERKLGE